MIEVKMIPPSKIKVGTRLRDGSKPTEDTVREMEELIESIRKWGIIHPLTITSSFDLIAGERRLIAANKLALKEAPAITRTADNAKMIEIIENTQRKGFTNYELMKAAVMLVGPERTPRGQLLHGKGEEASKVLGVPTHLVVNLVSMARKLAEDAKTYSGIESLLRDGETPISTCWSRTKAISEGGKNPVTVKPKTAEVVAKPVKEADSIADIQNRAKAELDFAEPAPVKFEPPKPIPVQYEKTKEEHVKKLGMYETRDIMLDQFGREVPTDLRDVFGANPEMNKFIVDIMKITKIVQGTYKPHIDGNELDRIYIEFTEIISNNQAHSVHTDCDGKGCEACAGKGYLNRLEHERITEENAEVPF